MPWFATSRQAYIYYMTPAVPFLAIVVASALARLAGKQPVACAPQAMGFAGGALLLAGTFGIAGLGEGLLGSAHGGAWRAAALMTAAVLAALVVALIARRRPRPPVVRAALTWAWVGAVTGLGVAWLPFLIGYPVLWQYYERLTWFPAWK